MTEKRTFDVDIRVGEFICGYEAGGTHRVVKDNFTAAVIAGESIILQHYKDKPNPRIVGITAGPCVWV